MLLHCVIFSTFTWSHTDIVYLCRGRIKIILVLLVQYLLPDEGSFNKLWSVQFFSQHYFFYMGNFDPFQKSSVGLLYFSHLPRDHNGIVHLWINGIGEGIKILHNIAQILLDTGNSFKLWFNFFILWLCFYNYWQIQDWKCCIGHAICYNILVTFNMFHLSNVFSD